MHLFKMTQLSFSTLIIPLGALHIGLFFKISVQEDCFNINNFSQIAKVKHHKKQYTKNYAVNYQRVVFGKINARYLTVLTHNEMPLHLILKTHLFFTHL